MKSAENTYKVIDEVGNTKLTAEEKLMFNALVEDSKSMDTRMTKLENNVNQILTDVSAIKEQQTQQNESINRLATMFQSMMDKEKSQNELRSNVVKNMWFWIALIVFMVLVFGGKVSDLAGVLNIQ